MNGKPLHCGVKAFFVQKKTMDMKYFNTIRLAIFTLCLVWIMPITGQGQTLDKTTQKQLKGFDASVEKEMKRWNVPGVSVAIVKDGKMLNNCFFKHKSLLILQYSYLYLLLNKLFFIN